ncbi:MAG: DUF6265 family protein, partial [Longimicrobiales bacterium]
WSDVRAGTQIGMFRMLVNGKLAVTELMLIETAGDSTSFTFQHFGSRLRPLDAKPLVYRQTAGDVGSLQFEASERIANRPRLIEYRKQDDGLRLTITGWSDAGPPSVDGYALRPC